MDKTMQSDLCKGLRACGLPKEETYQILNTIVKWYDSCGPEWTTDRLKEIKHWYLTILADDPQPPSWHKKNTRGYPVGIWGHLFKCRNHSKVLAVLSANTLFTEKSVSPRQKEKFLRGLRGNGLGDTRPSGVDRIIQNLPGWLPGWNGMTFPEVALPLPNCVTAVTIPIGDDAAVHVNSKEDRDRAYLESWNSVPDASLEYLDDLDHLDWIPIAKLVNKQDLTFRGESVVGRIGLIQEPALKLRAVANPNRIAQALTRPLADFWDAIVRRIPTDYTYNQEDGVRWAQEKVRSGVRLAGSDLSSATDLLSLKACLAIADHWVGAGLFNGEVRWTEEQIDQISWDYQIAVKHFVSLSRALWFYPEPGTGTRGGFYVRWQQGQPLGLYPSFRLLALTNNSLGMAAASMVGLPWRDSFAVIGDDIIMDERMSGVYSLLVESIGGEINYTKTLSSDRVAEFAGRIIEPSCISRKTYRYRDPGDTGFMSYVSDLGDQAKALLRPRQRGIWEHYKYVPGYVVEGPWSKDSFGIPLEDRLGWYLTSSGLLAETADPDPTIRSVELGMLNASLAGKAHGFRGDPEEVLPWPWDDAYLASDFCDTPLASGDPRLQNGKSTLEHLEDARTRSSQTIFQWMQERKAKGILPSSQRRQGPKR